VVALGGAFAIGRPSPTPSADPSPSLAGVVAPSSEPSATAPNPSAFPRSTGAWIATGTMGTPRYGHTAVRLLDGRVLVAGGSGANNEADLTSAELYDPESGTWSATGNMLKPHGCCGFPATLLRDGKVLVSDVDDPTVYDGIPGAEVYDPATGTWSSTGKLATTDRWLAAATATLLANGEVLVTGSDGAQLYDPDSGAWSATGKMTTSRYNHTATLLLDGKVLVAGGDGPPPVDSAELYDPETGAWTAIANMRPTGNTRADTSTATLLQNGTVLVERIATAELYNPATSTWTATAPRGVARGGGYTTLLPDGTLLVAGALNGKDGAGRWVQTAALLYDPRTGTWITTGSMLRQHPASAATLLLDGTVLVVGGWVSPGPTGATGSAELYVPAGVSPPPAVAALPSPTPIPTPTTSPPPPPVPPAVGPVPPGARTWTVTVDNKSSKPATLFAAEDGETGVGRLCGNVTPNVVPAGVTVNVTFLLPPKNVTSCWIWVNPVPGEGGSFFQTSDAPLKGGFHIDEQGQVMWG